MAREAVDITKWAVGTTVEAVGAVNEIRKARQQDAIDREASKHMESLHTISSNAQVQDSNQSWEKADNMQGDMNMGSVHQCIVGAAALTLFAVTNSVTK